MEKLVYYDVPQECVFIDEIEKILIGKDVELELWTQINFTRIYEKNYKFFKDNSKTLLNSVAFLGELLWELRKCDELIQIRIREKEIGKKPTYENKQCETKQALLDELKRVILCAPINCILYHKNDELAKAVLFEPGEQLNFFVKPNERIIVKAIMAKYAKETEYYKYELGEEM